ncbi:DUF5789 family protein [Halobellus salinisoli]|uniref:DUF5789 family protein n=1 Tax=Halobellus salinisoli TaxID=3108500 RepID=UPI00300A060E
MANEPDKTREHSIGFGALTGDLEDESYPLSHETLLIRCGDRVLDLVGDQVTLREVLSPEQERQYEDAESVRQAVFNMVGDEAIKQRDYSDRGGNDPEVDAATETKSVKALPSRLLQWNLISLLAPRSSALSVGGGGRADF